jgi:hypothetical protein
MAAVDGQRAGHRFAVVKLGCKRYEGLNLVIVLKPESLQAAGEKQGFDIDRDAVVGVIAAPTPENKQCFGGHGLRYGKA